MMKGPDFPHHLYLQFFSLLLLYVLFLILYILCALSRHWCRLLCVLVPFFCFLSLECVSPRLYHTYTSFLHLWKTKVLVFVWRRLWDWAGVFLILPGQVLYYSGARCHSPGYSDACCCKPEVPACQFCAVRLNWKPPFSAFFLRRLGSDPFHSLRILFWILRIVVSLSDFCFDWKTPI